MLVEISPLEQCFGEVLSTGEIFRLGKKVDTNERFLSEITIHQIVYCLVELLERREGFPSRSDFLLDPYIDLVPLYHYEMGLLVGPEFGFDEAVFYV